MVKNSSMTSGPHQIHDIPVSYGIARIASAKINNGTERRPILQASLTEALPE